LPASDADAFHVDDNSSSLGESAMSIVSVVRGQLAILAVEGTIDIVSAPQLSEAVHAALTGEVRDLIIDLSSTEFLASAGMTALVNAYEATTSAGQFAVVADGPATSRPLRLVGLDQVFTIHRTLDAALTALT
jgi:anti-anti-sigma factor